MKGDDGCLLLAIGYWLLAVGFWPLAIGRWLLAFGHWPLAQRLEDKILSANDLKVSSDSKLIVSTWNSGC